VHRYNLIPLRRLGSNSDRHSPDNAAYLNRRFTPNTVREDTRDQSA
jgi:hypothetical protein